MLHLNRAIHQCNRTWGIQVCHSFQLFELMHFPDWKERIYYQKKQEEFYKSAMKRKKEIKRIRLLYNKNYYTNEELDAMDYFNGTGFYQKKQDPKQKPNIFDTRQTFLLKMHNPILRNNFLKSLNSRSR